MPNDMKNDKVDSRSDEIRYRAGRLDAGRDANQRTPTGDVDQGSAGSDGTPPEGGVRTGQGSAGSGSEPSGTPSNSTVDR